MEGWQNPMTHVMLREEADRRRRRRKKCVMRQYHDGYIDYQFSDFQYNVHIDIDDLNCSNYGYGYGDSGSALKIK